MIDLWPTEHCDYLRELASCGGLSREQMADLLNGRFGTSYTRNSVIGKCGLVLLRRALRGQHPPAVSVGKDCLIICIARGRRMVAS